MWNNADTEQAIDVDFSISFGDVVFGFLFFFFILALALVFQKPQVKGFHKAIDLIANKYDTSKKNIKLLEHEVERLKREVERMKKELLEIHTKTETLELEKRTHIKKIEDLTEENYDFKKSLNQISDTQTQSWEKSDLVEKKYYEQLLHEKETLEREYDDIREKYLDEIDKIEDEQKKEAKSMYRNYLKILDTYQTKLQKFENYKSITEKVLKKKGMENILAEIADMSKKDESDEKGKSEAEMVEKSDIPRFQLHVKQYRPDDFNLELRVDGETESSYDGIDEDEVLRAIGNIMDRFEEASKGKDDKERAKLQPIAYVMVHPNVPYGAFNSFIVKSRQAIGKMSVVDWREE